jgi:hypothetical protein
LYVIARSGCSRAEPRIVAQPLRVTIATISLDAGRRREYHGEFGLAI